MDKFNNKPTGHSSKEDLACWREYIDKRPDLMATSLTELRDGMKLVAVLRQKRNSSSSFTKLSEKYINHIMAYLVEDGISLLSMEEIIFLYDYAKKCNGIIVEIGTCRAGSTAILGLSKLKNSDRVYSVDIVQAPRAKALLKQFGLFCNLIKSNSHTLGQSWDKGDIDMVFIDGNHMMAYVLADMQIWERHIIENGYMLMHDCLTKKKMRRYRNKKRIDENGMIKSKTTSVNVHNAVKLFLKDHENFIDIGQQGSLKVLQKVG
tara:strand:+ start:2552 stop:3340 length:789 start_codon:yes stop_codon:yes gene_type:complete